MEYFINFFENFFSFHFESTKEYFVWIISEHFSTPEDPRLNLAIGNIFLYWKSFIGK